MQDVVKGVTQKINYLSNHGVRDFNGVVDNARGNGVKRCYIALLNTMKMGSVNIIQNLFVTEFKWVLKQISLPLLHIISV